MLCGTGQLDSLVYWLMALDVESDVLEPPGLKERLRRASERVGEPQWSSRKVRVCFRTAID